MSGVDFVTIKTAIHTWVQLTSGLAGNHVVWSPLRDSRGNPVPRPTGMFISLSVQGLRSPGFDDVKSYTTAGSAGGAASAFDSSFDNSFTIDDSVMSQTLQGPRILVLSMQVFQGSPVGGSDVDPLSLLNDVLTGSDRDDVEQLLAVAHLGIGTYDDPANVPGPYNEAKQELRAFTMVKIHTRSRIIYTSAPGVGWIDTATVTGTLKTDNGTEQVIVSVTNP